MKMFFEIIRNIRNIFTSKKLLNLKKIAYFLYDYIKTVNMTGIGSPPPW